MNARNKTKFRKTSRQKKIIKEALHFPLLIYTFLHKNTWGKKQKNKRRERKLCYKRLVNLCRSLSTSTTPSSLLPLPHPSDRSSRRGSVRLPHMLVPSHAVVPQRLSPHHILWTPSEQSFSFLHIHLLPSRQRLVLAPRHLQCFLWKITQADRQTNMHTQ